MLENVSHWFFLPGEVVIRSHRPGQRWVSGRGQRGGAYRLTATVWAHVVVLMRGARCGDLIVKYRKKNEYDTRTLVSVLTVSDIRWREAVIDEKRGVFGHMQVNNVGGRLQHGHGLLMCYLLQTGGVDLDRQEQRRCQLWPNPLNIVYLLNI